MRNACVPKGLWCVILASFFAAGCHHTQASANRLVGTWKLSAAVLGQGTITFDEDQFTERWPASAASDAGALVISGPYQLTDGTLHLNPKQCQIVGNSTDQLTMIQDDLKLARAWDFSVRWSRDDLAYLNATGSFASTVVMAITRGDVKVNPSKLAFNFTGTNQSAPSNPSTATGDPRNTSPALDPAAASEHPELTGPKPYGSAPEDPSSSQGVTIVTGPSPQDYAPEPTPAQQGQQDSPATNEGGQDQGTQPPSGGDVQRF